jgi:hypothetical protein
MLPVIIKTPQTSTSTSTSTSSMLKALNSSLIEETVNIIKDIRNSKLFEIFQNEIGLQSCSNPILYTFLIIFIVLFIVSLILLFFFLPRIVSRLKVILNSKMDGMVASNIFLEIL